MRRFFFLSRGASAAGALCFGCFTSAVSLRARCFTPGTTKRKDFAFYGATCLGEALCCDATLVAPLRPDPAETTRGR